MVSRQGLHDGSRMWSLMGNVRFTVALFLLITGLLEPIEGSLNRLVCVCVCVYVRVCDCCVRTQVRVFCIVCECVALETTRASRKLQRLSFPGSPELTSSVTFRRYAVGSVVRANATASSDVASQLDCATRSVNLTRASRSYKCPQGPSFVA